MSSCLSLLPPCATIVSLVHELPPNGSCCAELGQLVDQLRSALRNLAALPVAELKCAEKLENISKLLQTVCSFLPFAANLLRLGMDEGLDRTAQQLAQKLGTAITIINEAVSKETEQTINSTILGSDDIARLLKEGLWGDADNTVISQGQFGNTFRTKLPSCGQSYAVKTLQFALLSRSRIATSTLLDECRTLRDLAHPNIVRYLATHQANPASDIQIVMEHIEGESLADKIEDLSLSQLTTLPTEADLMKWTGQMASALAYLHSKGMQHRDLKPENVKITEDGDIKLVGMKLPSLATRSESVSVFTSYERASGMPYDGRDDVWALGCILSELLTRSRNLYTQLNHPSEEQRRQDLIDTASNVSAYLGGTVLPHLLRPLQAHRFTAQQLLDKLTGPTQRGPTRKRKVNTVVTSAGGGDKRAAYGATRGTSVPSVAATTEPLTGSAAPFRATGGQTQTSKQAAPRMPTTASFLPDNLHRFPPTVMPPVTTVPTSSSSTNASPTSATARTHRVLPPWMLGAATQGTTILPPGPARGVLGERACATTSNRAQFLGNSPGSGGLNNPGTADIALSTNSAQGAASSATGAVRDHGRSIGKGRSVQSSCEQTPTAVQTTATEQCDQTTAENVRIAPAPVRVAGAQETSRAQTSPAPTPAGDNGGPSVAALVNALKNSKTAMDRDRAARQLELYSEGSARALARIAEVGGLQMWLDLLGQGPESSQCLAARALHSLISISKDLALTSAAVAGGAIPPLVQMLRQASEVGQVAAVALLARIIHSSAAHADAVARAGAIEPIVQLLSAGVGNAKQNAAAALWDLALSSPQHRAAMVAAGAIPSLIQLLRDGSVADKGYAAGALKQLAIDYDDRATIARAGALPSLEALLAEPDERCQEQAAAALRLLVYNPVTGSVWARRTTVPALVRLMKEGSRKASEHAAAALRTVAAYRFSDGTVSPEVLEEALGPLVQQLRDGSPQDQLQGAKELAALTDTAPQREAIAKAGAISVLVSLLRATSQEVGEQAAATLLALAVGSERRERMVEAGAVEPLVQMLRDGTARGQELAAGVLKCLSISARAAAAISSAGTLSLLVSLLDHGTDWAKAYAAGVLANLSRRRALVTAIAETGVIKRLVQLLSLQNSLGARGYAIQALTYLGSDPVLRRTIVSLGATTAMSALLRSGSMSGCRDEKRRLIPAALSVLQ